jgi:hypothetical protein
MVAFNGLWWMILHSTTNQKHAGMAINRTIGGETTGEVRGKCNTIILGVVEVEGGKI